jgi:hypothetical protein
MTNFTLKKGAIRENDDYLMASRNDLILDTKNASSASAQ